MVKLNFVIIFILLSYQLIAAGLDNFDNFMSEEKYEEALQFLDRWAKDNQDDPRLYFCYFNYYLTTSKQEGIGIQSQPPKEAETLELTDQDTGEVVG